MREKWGRFKGELIKLNFLETLAEPGRVHGLNEQKNMRTEQNKNDSCVNYVGSLQKKAGQFKDIVSTGQLVK